MIDILERDPSSNASTRQRFYKRQVQENTKIQKRRNGLEYDKRAYIVEYSIRSYGDFMKKNLE